MTIGELTVELHVGVSVIYNIRSSGLSYQFYIITYTLDKIHIDLHATMAVPFIIVLCPYSMHLHVGNYVKESKVIW